MKKLSICSVFILMGIISQQAYCQHDNPNNRLILCVQLVEGKDPKGTCEDKDVCAGELRSTSISDCPQGKVLCSCTVGADFHKP